MLTDDTNVNPGNEVSTETDAPVYVKAAATHVLNAAGGTGAFREVADSILFAQGKDAVLGTAAGYAQVMAKMAQ